MPTCDIPDCRRDAGPTPSCNIHAGMFEWWNGRAPQEQTAFLDGNYAKVPPGPLQRALGGTYPYTFVGWPPSQDMTIMPINDAEVFRQWLLDREAGI